MSLSMNNVYMKAHNRFLAEASPRNLLITDNQSTQMTENNNQIMPNVADKTIQEVWSKSAFQSNNNKTPDIVEEVKKMSWAENTVAAVTAPILEPTEDSAPIAKKADEEEKMEDDPGRIGGQEREENGSPSHHARRPMNAFLIFCKKHRPIVRAKFPNLENRGVTRILGEWWAVLDRTEKAPYTDLAKEYKDAFLSANPDFKWYKLPAPPLRTLNVRPTSSHKAPSPVSSPNHGLAAESEFNLGKLADESQLGSLTSLMNNNFMPSKHDNAKTRPTEDNNNVEKSYNSSLESPVNLIQTTLPPKPIKKRIIYENQFIDNKNVVRNLTKEDLSPAHDLNEDNMTHQDLLDKVVDTMFTKNECDYDDSNGENAKEVRKSGRQCKGKRYEKFMVEGRLLGNKRDTKLTSQRFVNVDKIKDELNVRPETKSETETPNLNHTIKRLAERTNLDHLLDDCTAENGALTNERVRTISETSENSETGGLQAKNSYTSSFNLELRISELPSLSYEVFSQRKKDSKKRKNRIRTTGAGGGGGDGEPKTKMMKMVAKEAQLVGSKKRKNKLSITHLEKKEEPNATNDLIGLETLAEVAANTQKIDEIAVTSL